MRIKMRSTMAGPDGVLLAGHIGEVEDAKGAALIAAGYAEAVESTEVIKEKPKQEPQETATAEPSENAMAPPPRRRRGRA